jgi:subfamily B ATP-binding cassette protein MsbA
MVQLGHEMLYCPAHKVLRFDAQHYWPENPRIIKALVEILRMKETTDSHASPPVQGSAAGETGLTAKSPWHLARRMVREYLWQHRRPLLIAIAFMLVISLTTAALAWLLRPAIQLLFVEKDPQFLYTLPALIISVTILKALATYAQGVLMTKIGQDVVAEMQVKLFHSMVYADLQRLTSTHTGEFMARALNNVILVQQAASQTVAALAMDLTTILALTFVMFYQDWRLALIVICVVPFVLLNTRKQSRKTRKATKSSMSETGNLSALISENLDGTRVVRAYGQEEREIERTTESIMRRRNFQMKALKARIAAAPVTEGITGVAIAAVIFYGGYQGINGPLTLAAFMSFLMAMLMSYGPLKKVSNLTTVLAQGLTAAETIFGELDIKPSIRDAEDAKALKLNGGRVSFENATFHYGDDKAALNDVSFTVEPGETVALVGPSGAGKSTVLNLIPRFYDATTGSVKIDGQDVRGLTLESLRGCIGLVTQDPFLFDDTIYANIAYSRPEATREDVIAAAKAAAAHEFIEEKPGGYDAPAGEGGSNLSGGQRQRIAIARAILKNAPILLLDEATSALDTRSEAHVQEALHRLMAERTTIVIAHRLSTIIDADKIFVMDEGRVVESGRHAELLQNNSLYSTLYSSMLEHQKEVADDFNRVGG